VCVCVCVCACVCVRERDMLIHIEKEIYRETRCMHCNRKVVDVHKDIRFVV